MEYDDIEKEEIRTSVDCINCRDKVKVCYSIYR